MGEKVVIPINVSVSPSSTRVTTLYTVPDAKVLKLKKIELHFPSGVSFDLTFVLLYGNMQVYPATGSVTGSDTPHVNEIDVTYFSGDQVKCRVTNSNTTETLRVVGTLEGELE